MMGIDRMMIPILPILSEGSGVLQFLAAGCMSRAVIPSEVGGDRLISGMTRCVSERARTGRAPPLAPEGSPHLGMQCLRSSVMSSLHGRSPAAVDVEYLSREPLALPWCSATVRSMRLRLGHRRVRQPRARLA